MKLLPVGLFCLVCLAYTPAQKSSDLTVVINGIESVKGEVRIAVFDSQEGFDNRAFVCRTFQKVESNKLTYTFVDLPQGQYMVVAFHDKNSNGELNKNLLGVPTEKYGFSNNIRPTFRAPSFEETSFFLDMNKSVTIDLQ